mgnify:FL=1
MSTRVHVEHGEIPPVFDEHSTVLVLGTMPSPKSREAGFYYAHPQNRFWSVLAALFDEHVPETTEERRSFALRHRIALWDVLAQCDIEGASDAAIKNPVPNDVAALLRGSNIRAVFTTGKAAARLYKRFCEPAGCPPAVELPSTSPANARLRLADLAEAYKVILEYL